jgi:hypothetical protein
VHNHKVRYPIKDTLKLVTKGTTMFKLDEAWLNEQGVKAANPAELEDLLARVVERMRRQINILVAGELTAKKLAEFDKLWAKDEGALAEEKWLTKNLPNTLEFTGRVRQSIGESIEAARYKKALIQSWAKQAAIVQPKGQPKFDEAWLKKQGIVIKNGSTASELLKKAYDELEMRVGITLGNQMTNEQLDTFEAFFAAKDDAGAFAWLEQNMPDYKKVVAKEFAALGKEVKAAKNKRKLIESWNT